MTDRELLQMALDALEHLQTDVEWQYKSPTRAMLRKVEKALRARLAQPEPWVKTYSGGKPNYTESCERCGEVNPAEIHTCTPKQREWQGLTKDEVNNWELPESPTVYEFAQFAEAKLKEKNA